MGNGTVFLDRDGTIARDAHYCSRVEDFELLSAVPEAIKLLNEKGFKVVVVTNQSGIARGYFTVETLAQIHQKMQNELAQHGAHVDSIYYCPHHPDDGCDCRKPGTALFLEAARNLDIDFGASYVVGDMQLDIDAGKTLGCKTILVTTGPGGDIGGDVSPDYVASNLLEAAEWICTDSSIKTTVIVPAYNEEEGLPVVLEKIMAVIDSSYEVIVVDDASTDRTGEIASQYPCRVVGLDTNQGKGEALKAGIACARGENVIWIDADDTYPAEAIPLMAHALDFYDMVVGSRVYGRGNIPMFNRIGNFVLRHLIRGIYGFRAYDPLTGLWGLKKRHARRVLPTVRFAPDAEMGMKAARLKLRTLDIPITYMPRKGQTKLQPLRAGYEHLKLILSLLSWRPDDSEKSEP